jgi:ABC-type transport system substrate-binding protein
MFDYARAVRSALVLLAVSAAIATLAGAAPGDARGVREGGTFKVSVSIGYFGAVDPALFGPEIGTLRPACAALMSYPNKPLPAGLQLRPELAQSYPTVSTDRLTYTFTIRSDAHFSTGSPVTAADVVHSLERIFDPRMKAFNVDFESIVGAREFLQGKATTLAGATASGRTLRLRLTKPVHDFLARLSTLCVVPATLAVDPEGAKAPLPSPAPYYVSEYVPGERVVLERNRFYRGERPRHVDRFTVDLKGQRTALADVAAGKLDHAAPTPDLFGQLAGLVNRFGVNRSRLFVQPDVVSQMFLINTARPLFRNNVGLRQALNFAVDRRALVRAFGPHSVTATDQYLPRALPGFRDERIYPLDGPDLRRARALAKGRTRSGTAVLYTCSDRPDCSPTAQILKQNLKAIGLEVRIKQFPLSILFQRAAAPGEPFDLVWIGFGFGWPDPQAFLELFDGRTIGTPENQNFSYLNVPEYNRLLERAGRLSGPARYRAYGELDVRIARDAAPAIAVASRNIWAFVSARTGCIVMNPGLDLTAVCLK